MSRVARWRRGPEDPRTAWGYVVRNEFRLSRGQRRTLGVAIPALFAALVLSGFLVPLLGPLVLGILGVAGLLLYLAPGAREHAALPTMGEDANFPITFESTRGGRRLGLETGWVAFADGWLVYEGMRTAFAVRPDTVRATKDLGGGTVRLRLADGTRVRLTLLNDPFQTRRPARIGDGRRFRRTFDAWRSGPAPSGEPVLPPSGRNPVDLGVYVGRLGLSAMLLGPLSVLLFLGNLPTAGGIAAVLALLGAVDAVRGYRLLTRIVAEERTSLPHGGLEALGPGEP